MSKKLVMAVMPLRIYPLNRWHSDMKKWVETQHSLPMHFSVAHKEEGQIFSGKERKRMAEACGFPTIITKSTYNLEAMKSALGVDEIVLVLEEKDSKRFLSDKKHYYEFKGVLQKKKTGIIIIPDDKVRINRIRPNYVFEDMMKKLTVESMNEYFPPCDKDVIADVFVQRLLREGAASAGAGEGGPESNFTRPGKKRKLKYAGWQEGWVQLDFPKADDPFGADEQRRYRDEVIINPPKKP